MRFTTIAALGLSLLAIPADATPSPAPPRPLASSMKWDGFLASEGPESKTLYSLLSGGYMGFPGERLHDGDEQLSASIKAWVAAHPDARVVPVAFIPFEKELGITYAWLVAGSSNLNVELVRKGLVQARQMLLTDGAKQLIARDEYDRFEAAIQQAELSAISAQTGVWARKETQHDGHWQRAEALERERKFREAIAEFKLSLRGEDYEELDALAWLRIARCYDAAGDYKAALFAFDKSVDRGDGPPHDWSYFEKARCIGKHEGVDKAVEMLEGVIAAAPDDIERYQVLAEFEHLSNRNTRAIKAMERGTARFEKRTNIQFDAAGAILWDVQRVGQQGDYMKNAQQLQFEYGRLAEFYWAGGNPDQALRSCERALSISRKIMSYPPDYCGADVIEAGDASCRGLRARVFMDRGALAEAQAELTHLKVLLDSGNLQGDHADEPYQKLSQELARRTAAAK